MKTIFQRLWPLIKPYKSTLILLLFLGATVSALRGSVPELTRRLFDFWQAGDADYNIALPVGIAVIWLISSIVKFYHMYITKFMSEKIGVVLRKNLMDKYLELDVNFVSSGEKGSGGLIARATNEVLYIQFGVQKLSDILREPFASSFMLIYLFFIDWKLTIFIFVTIPIVGIVLKNLGESIRKYSTRSLTDLEDISKTIKEGLDGSKIVKSFNLQDFLTARFSKTADEFLRNRKIVVHREEIAGPVIESLSAVSLSIILIYIGSQIMGGSLSVSDFMGFFFAIGILQDSVKRMQQSYVALQQASAAIKRYDDLLNSEVKIQDPTQPVDFPSNWDEVHFNNINFSYSDERKILENFDLKIKKGQTIALVGSSGSGKSTLTNLLQRFYDPDSGSIEIGGQDIRNFKIKDLRQNIGLVSQDPFLFNDTVELNIQTGNFDASSEDIQQAAKLANAHDFIMSKPDHYQARMGDVGTTFSGGEKQRVSIARAILKNAPILILDEATSALDSQSEIEVQTALGKLMEGKTALVIAHRLSTITGADRILVMKEGKIIEEGTHQELLDLNSHYADLYKKQI
ncbi:MAG: ABC transporter ATP-binding protein [Bdellovibrionales bacterium]